MTQEELYKKKIELKGKIKEIYYRYESRPEEKIWLSFFEKYGNERTAKVLDPDSVTIQMNEDGHKCTFKCHSFQARNELEQHEEFLKHLSKKYKNLVCKIKLLSFKELFAEFFRPLLHLIKP